MLLKLLLLFTIVPVIEFYLLYQLSMVMGNFWIAIGIVILTGIVGAFLAKLQGLRTLEAIRKDLSAGIIPGDRILDGLIILVSSALLVTPGILTDAVGLCMLVPFLRRPVRNAIKKRLRRKVEEGKIAFYHAAGFRAAPPERKPSEEEPPGQFPEP